MEDLQEKRRDLVYGFLCNMKIICPENIGQIDDKDIGPVIMTMKEI
jgi:hypothetical protein